MTTFYICRHGETENNKHGRLSGWIDTPLTEEGNANALATATKLSEISIDKVISSDLGRAFVTAYVISTKLGISSEIERKKGLREVSYGDLANILIVDAMTTYASEFHSSDSVAPGGESLVQMQQRVLACIDDITHVYPNKTILLVTHDGTIKAVYASFANIDIGKVDKATTYPHDFAAKFVYQNGTIISFDAVAM